MDTPDLDHPVHPRFAAHLTDGLYTDEDGEFSPFDTNEGWDLLEEWSERRDDLGSDATVLDVAELEPEGVEALRAGTADEEQADVATIIVGAGFTLARLTGRIDRYGKATVLAALEQLQAVHRPPPELERMRTDLTAFPADGEGP